MEFLLERGRSRDREALFEALVGVVAVPLHRYLSRRTDPGSVDDVLAETMVVLWRRLEDVPELGAGRPVDPAGVLPWCYGVARGCLANARRAEGRRQRLVDRLTRVARPAASWPGAAESGDGELDHALRKLSPLDREVLLLWAWEELAPREIAEAMGTTPNAVSIRLHRAKKKLAAMLERKNAEMAGQMPGEGHGRSDR
ncbi:RNA polymerase sigma factor [Streptomyces sp. NPDC090106]|uniref:RNA polymerase sigma factor n=1 Tax=Streptomyces sp. NPDC090106 TaxID=3365946 RepID=UPI00380ED886